MQPSEIPTQQTKIPITNYTSITVGADPELFFSRGGRIVSSDKVVPERGESSRWWTTKYNHASGYAYHRVSDDSLITDKEVLKEIQGDNYVTYESKVVRDGVQVELNPRASTCRAGLGNSVSSAFKTLKRLIKDTDIKVDFREVIELTDEDIADLPESCRQLGCQPSENFYGPADIGVDPVTYRIRSAGGHLHFGSLPGKLLTKKYNTETLKYVTISDRRPELVPGFDILVGNTCVLLDRDPRAGERRLVYGRAGEYRIQPHGIEYRTLSNFWLRHYALMSLVTGLGRMAILAFTDETIWKALLKSVDLGNVIKAINTNDFDLAKENFVSLKPWIEAYAIEPHENSAFADTWPLSGTKLADFEFFVEKGLDHWFKTDPMTHWTEEYLKNASQAQHGGYRDYGHAGGWDSFLTQVVRKERLANV